MTRINYLYILSQRYSGSTLLSFLLGNHPEVATIGERRKFYAKAIDVDQKAAQLCSCGQPFVQCPYWMRIKETLESQLSPAQLRTNFTEFEPFANAYLNKAWDRWGSPKLLARRYARMYAANELLVRQILDFSNGQTFLDSSKTYKHLLHLQQVPAFDVKVIWLTRDPRAQVSSALKYNRWSVTTATQHWLRNIKTYEDLLRTDQLPYLAIRYEELCRNTTEVLEEILSFAGLPTDQVSLDFRKGEQHIMGNGAMRLGTDTEIRERKDWQKRLTADQIAQIETLTQDYHHYYTDFVAP